MTCFSTSFTQRVVNAPLVFIQSHVQRTLAHTKDPAKAKPWVASYGVSGLYMMDECCTYPTSDGSTHVFRNKHDNNEFPPLTLNVEDRWEDLGEVSLWQ